MGKTEEKKQRLKKRAKRKEGGIPSEAALSPMIQIKVNGVVVYEGEGQGVDISEKQIGISENDVINVNNSVIAGRRMQNVVIGKNHHEIRVEVFGDVGKLWTSGSATIHGDVSGKVDAGGSVHCGNVLESVDAGGSVDCGDVAGDVDAGGSVNITKSR